MTLLISHADWAIPTSIVLPVISLHPEANGISLPPWACSGENHSHTHNSVCHNHIMLDLKICTAKKVTAADGHCLLYME
jgi:hypothetical protein